jgi:hypothetical protein
MYFRPSPLPSADFESRVGRNCFYEEDSHPIYQQVKTTTIIPFTAGPTIVPQLNLIRATLKDSLLKFHSPSLELPSILSVTRHSDDPLWTLQSVPKPPKYSDHLRKFSTSPTNTSTQSTKDSLSSQKHDSWSVFHMYSPSRLQTLLCCVYAYI